jgi:hypothetical protein
LQTPKDKYNLKALGPFQSLAFQTLLKYGLRTFVKTATPINTIPTSTDSKTLSQICNFLILHFYTKLTLIATLASFF